MHLFDKVMYCDVTKSQIKAGLLTTGVSGAMFSVGFDFDLIHLQDVLHAQEQKFNTPLKALLLCNCFVSPVYDGSLEGIHFILPLCIYHYSQEGKKRLKGLNIPPEEREGIVIFHVRSEKEGHITPWLSSTVSRGTTSERPQSFMHLKKKKKRESEAKAPEIKFGSLISKTYCGSEAALKSDLLQDGWQPKTKYRPGASVVIGSFIDFRACRHA